MTKSSKKFTFFLSIALIAAGLYLRGYYQSYYQRIPIDFASDYHLPCTFIEIEGKPYHVEIDLGTKIPLSLHKDVLEIIHKIPSGTSRRMDFKGNKYETPLYDIPKVQIGDLRLKKVRTREESPTFVTQESIVVEAEEKRYKNAGRLGRDFLAGKNLLMDFKNSVLIACSSAKDLIQDHYDTEKLTPVPFRSTADGILLDIETDLGPQTFVLDTGSTISSIRSQVAEERLTVIKTAKFSMNGIDFGPQKLMLLDISAQFEEISGFLGMDFLSNHVIYLDFSKNIAYIEKFS